VSTEQQVGPDKYGLESQVVDIEAWARANDFELVQQFKDAGISGSTLERPGINDCLAAAARHEFDVVIVAKLDRFSRDLMNSLCLRADFLSHGVQVVSVAEPYDAADPTSRLLMQIVCAFAEYEKHRITARMSAGRKMKASIGGYAGGGAPIGYTSLKGSKVLTVEPAGAAAVQEVFELRALGLSMEHIATALNFEGHTTAKGTDWRGEQVRRVLARKAVYAGGYTYSGIIATKGLQEAILEA
jgi:site-specific DNA recombinase